jgi:hypothetical protein
VHHLQRSQLVASMLEHTLAREHTLEVTVVREHTLELTVQASTVAQLLQQLLVSF